VSSRESFTRGQQPCDNFTPDEEFYGHNEHECWCCGPRARGEAVQPGDCHGTVSFCRNCHSDHHSEGYDSCPQCRDESEEQ
jgi:hypothetical protein